MSRFRLRIALVLLMLVSGWSAPNADELSLDERLDIPQPRFRPFEPNYAIWQETQDDDQAMEARYSFKYLMSAPDCTDRYFPEEQDRENCRDNYRSRRDIFITYTGEFDFYMTTRDSSPVVNRINNPAFHYRKYMGEKEGSYSIFRYLDFAFQHLSNGQTTDAELSQNGEFITQTEYLNNPSSTYFDSISRSANFLSVEAGFRLGAGRNNKDPVTGRCSGGGEGACFDLWIRLIPWYQSDDNPVTWGPNMGLRSRIADYDRIRIIFARKRLFEKNARDLWFKEADFNVAWTVGDDLLKTDSVNASLFFPLSIDRWNLTIPLFAEFHYGPLNNLSNYTKKDNSFGIGLRFY